MSIKVLLLIFTSITLSAVGQICMKAGMSSPAVQAGLQSKSYLQSGMQVLSNGYVISGLFMYAVSAMLWLLVLADTDVSKAYPFIGLGFILTMAMAAFFLNEGVSIARISGTFLVVLGVVLVARS